MKEATYQAKLLLQVHDELIFEVPKSEVDSFSEFRRDNGKCIAIRCSIKSRLKLWCNLV